MQLSMTGYGKSVKETEAFRITIETRSVNSKSADVSLRIPSDVRPIEMELRKEVMKSLVRGKIDLSISIEPHGNTLRNKVDTELAKAYWDELNRVHREVGVPLPQDPMKTLLSLPGIFVSSHDEEEEKQKQTIVLEVLHDTLEAHTNFREQEGAALEAGFRKNIAAIQELLDQVPQYEKERIETIKKRLDEGLKKYIETDYDKSRLEQELIYYIEKLDINEEKCRLQNHLTYFIETMETEPNAGRKLGFISQEIGREINTLGSKSNHAELQKLVVHMKDELEQIKEQILNVL